MPKIAIFDYGAGNLFNLQQSLLRNGAHVDIVDTLRKIQDYDGIVLPGVGNFDNAIESIKNSVSSFIDAMDSGVPILGICLGLEMLFCRSEEGTLEGLKILDGDVVMLPKISVKVPHMGWNNLEMIRKDSKLLNGIEDGSWVYFVHSYRINPTDKSIVVATSQYGGTLSAAMEQENVFGTQFHPEKSGVVGSQIIRNYIEMCSGKK
jgi:imidazole glycerol-phosphate synthase subunit HisH